MKYKGDKVKFNIYGETFDGEIITVDYIKEKLTYHILAEGTMIYGVKEEEIIA